MRSILRHSAIALVGFSTPALAQVDWTQISTANGPFPFCGSCWDSTRDRIVAFGGEVTGVESSAMREWDGTSWSNINPGLKPSARTRPAMAFDAARGETVLFGGGTSFRNDTWTYDGSTWTQESPSTVPPVRFGAAMVYDAARQVVVLFGGFVPSGQDAADVWEWDGSNWTQRPSLVSPPPRGAHRMVYHDDLQATFLCGGYSTPNLSTLPDAWTWDGTSWTQVANMPDNLCDQALAYDPGRRRVMLFGGLRIQNGTQTNLQAVYEFDGSTWITRNPPGPLPIARSATAFAYDEVNGRMLVAGGSTSFGTQFDTWSYELTQPASVTTFGQPCVVTQGADLEMRSLPYIGLPFEQAIVNASPSAAIGLLVFGGSNTDWNGVPLPADLSSIGAPACSLNVSLDVAATVSLSNGTGTTTWNLPVVPAAVGGTFYTQGAVIDPASPLPFPLDMTSGRALVIGNP